MKASLNFGTKPSSRAGNESRNTSVASVAVPISTIAAPNNAITAPNHASAAPINAIESELPPSSLSASSPASANTPYGALQPLLDDPSVEEIWINSPQRIFVARNGRSELTTIVLNADQVRSLMDRILLWSGRRIDLSQPFVDARLPDGSRLHIAIPEITAENWAINIRKHLMRGKSMSDLIEMQVLDQAMFEVISEALQMRKNILVSGATQAGKTTLLNALVSAVPVEERVITIEEVFELRPRLPDCIAMQTKPANLEGVGEINIRRLIKEALRMRPSRIVIGEIREAESLDLLIALNSGVPGMATLHANSATEALRKLQTLPLLAGENITQDFLTPTIAQAIDLVIHVGFDEKGQRRVLQMNALTGRCEGNVIETEPLFTWKSDCYVRGLGQLRRISETRR